MSISTYTELQTAIANWLARDDLTARIPEFIVNAEARFNRELRVNQMVTSTTLTLSSGTASLPATYLEWLSATWIGASRSQDLVFMEPNSEQWRFRYRPNQDPTMFTIMDSTFFTKPSGGSQNVTFYFYRTIPDLATNSTNWLLTAAPHIYLNASLMEACVFVHDDERARSFWELVEQDIANLNAEGDADKVSRRGSRDSEISDRTQARSNQAGTA